MKRLAGFGLLFCVMLSLSCAKEEPGLEIGSTPQEAYFIDGTIAIPETSACYEEQTFEGPMFTLQSITTRWSGEGTFQPVLLRITIEPRSGLISRYTCSIIGKNANLPRFLGFGDADEDGVGDRTIGTGEQRTGNCAVICGSVGLLTEDRDFVVNAELKMIGVQTLADGVTQRPATATKILRLRYIR